MSENHGDSTDFIVIEMDKIVLGDRVRTVQDDERLKSLKTSIEKDGLLQPIIINQDNKLIAGYRRYSSYKELGYSTIQAKRINTKDDLHEKLIEIKENVDRKAFTFSEKMKAAGTIEPIIKEMAEQRVKRKKETDLSQFGIVAKKGKTRDIIAEILGFGSGKTYDKAKYVWDAKDEEIISLLDQGKQTISRAYNRIRQTKKLLSQTPANAFPVTSIPKTLTHSKSEKQSMQNPSQERETMNRKDDIDGDNLPLIDDILFELGSRIDNNNYTYNELKKIRNIFQLIQEKIEEQIDKSSPEYKIKNKWQQNN